MPSFKVKSHVTHDGKEYEIGSTVEMTEKQGAAIPWAVDPIVEAAPPAPPAPEKKPVK